MNWISDIKDHQDNCLHYFLWQPECFCFQLSKGCPLLCWWGDHTFSLKIHAIPFPMHKSIDDHSMKLFCRLFLIKISQVIYKGKHLLFKNLINRQNTFVTVNFWTFRQWYSQNWDLQGASEIKLKKANKRERSRLG